MFSLCFKIGLCFSFLLLSGCALLDLNRSGATHFHTVVLDPGHGGYDSGARASSGLPEKMLTLDVAQRTKPLLEAKGYHVVMTRTQDIFIPLGTRTDIANKHLDAIFVSIHFNSSPSHAAHGIETYYYNSGSSRLAAKILHQLLPVYHARERGVKRAVYFVLHHNKRPATLLELGFVSNGNENAMIQKPATRQQLAAHIAQGIADCHE
ncbi:MAG: N-acetylmuramoyl-L-alanine amidase [Chthoniobacterales bacterium]|nr:N-acetylmuramoyl-L-alanine amidase [Chthoniobacterales bacterium]